MGDKWRTGTYSQTTRRAHRIEVVILKIKSGKWAPRPEHTRVDGFPQRANTEFHRTARVGYEKEKQVAVKYTNSPSVAIYMGEPHHQNTILYTTLW